MNRQSNMEPTIPTRKQNRVGSIVSVKKWEEVKKVEQVEDCFILEFDPTKIDNVLSRTDKYKDKDKRDGLIVSSDDDDDDDDEIVGSIVCVRKKEDVRKIEEVEDCFILEFDPFQENISFNVHFSKLGLVSVKSEVVSGSDSDSNDDISILGVKGQVACRDFPHSRHLCGTHPFKKTPHQIHCKMCYCYVCDKSAPCQKWTQGCKDPNLKHCDATPDIPLWKRRRDRKKLQRNKG